eukprot:CAMPEP_0173423194 /NCGR_PEP_ID=MMETSP1357-20121228/3599_1 /TAXON_ID=77926 /ORGANISM="Hemiselmis rufescens, Strain PCC563" /LENGTH=185 /DNA_ID=CAMNT_0014386287 /DNA_START=164 /DNA_END=718 /DNA_ORIENTATION=-
MVLCIGKQASFGWRKGTSRISTGRERQTVSRTPFGQVDTPPLTVSLKYAWHSVLAQRTSAHADDGECNHVGGRRDGHARDPPLGLCPRAEEALALLRFRRPAAGGADEVRSDVDWHLNGEVALVDGLSHQGLDRGGLHRAVLHVPLLLDLRDVGVAAGHPALPRTTGGVAGAVQANWTCSDRGAE